MLLEDLQLHITAEVLTYLLWYKRQHSSPPCCDRCFKLPEVILENL